MAIDVFMVIPTAATEAGKLPPLAEDPVQDSYFSKTFAKAAAVVPIRSFSLSTENPTTVGSTTSAAGAGKATFNPLQVQKSFDRLSSYLLAVSASGAHFPTVQIFVRKTGDSQPGKPYAAYEFSMVYVSQIAWSGGDGDEAPVEQIELVYGALTLGYYPQQPNGSLGKPTTLGWSQITNTQTPTGPDTLSGF